MNTGKKINKKNEHLKYVSTWLIYLPLYYIFKLQIKMSPLQ